MRRVFSLILALAWFASATYVVAQQFATFEQLTVGATAVGISATTINPSGQGQMEQCTARLETAQVRFRWDGTAPTSSVGTLLEVGDVLPPFSTATAIQLKLIRTGGSSGVLDVHCWR